jgi:hypothetical protein
LTPQSTARVSSSENLPFGRRSNAISTRSPCQRRPSRGWFDFGVFRTTHVAFVLVECDPPWPCLSKCSFRKKSRDAVLRGSTRAALPFRFPSTVILPCRWPRARRTVASPSQTEVRVGGHSCSCASSFPPSPSPKTSESERPSHEVWLPSAR